MYKATGFYYVDDVMKLVGCKRTKAYNIIKALNNELRDEGYYTYDGRVPKRRFNERFYFSNVQAPKRSKKEA